MNRKIERNNRHSNADFTKRLAGYSLTAGLVLASGGKAQAGIIYSGPMNQSFGENYGDYDLTMEGTNPEARFHGDTMGGESLKVTRLNDNFSAKAFDMFSIMYMLPSSTRIGPNDTLNDNTAGFFYFHSLLFYIDSSHLTVFTGPHGHWTQNGQSGYFGFTFDLENESAGGAAAGTTVYGWGLVERIDSANGRLLGWAYEDSGGEIHVGDTGSDTSPIPVPSALGLAALGAAGVLSMRRRKKG